MSEKRKSYSKPEMREIDLASEEVLDTGCKTSAPTPYDGPTSSTDSCTVANCSNIANT